MSWLFGKKAVAPTVATAELADTGIGAVSKTATVSSAIAVAAGAAAAGPALPIVLGVAVAAAVCVKLYAQNKKLAKMFVDVTRTVDKVNLLLTKMKAVADKKQLPLDVTPVTQAATDLQGIIAKFAGPQVMAEINKDLAEGRKPDQKPAGYWDRARRSLTAGLLIGDLREKLVNLSIAFSILQSEFALQLDDPENEALAATAGDVETPTQVTPENAGEVAKANAVAASAVDENPAPPQGAGRRKTRRRRPRSKTRRLSKK